MGYPHHQGHALSSPLRGESYLTQGDKVTSDIRVAEKPKSANDLMKGPSSTDIRST